MVRCSALKIGLRVPELMSGATSVALLIAMLSIATL